MLLSETMDNSRRHATIKVSVKLGLRQGQEIARNSQDYPLLNIEILTEERKVYLLSSAAAILSQSTA